ncbi:MAG: GNAT family N-acetyltransferase [Turicibacter sp.]|nr:GNAT family N-acetyltransferase [Turicibacter sp.]
MNFTQADKLDFDPRPQMGEIFVDGFGQHMSVFSRDKKRLTRAFAHIFNLSDFYVAHENGIIKAMTACTSGAAPVRFDKAACQRELGFLRGWLAYSQLTKFVVEHKFPFEFAENMGRIEIVATAAAFRGQGAAFGLIGRIMEITPFEEYVLEVVNDNYAAIRLYEKLGFAVFTEASVPWYVRRFLAGFLYMKCGK